MTKCEEMAQQLRDNPTQARAVYGDVTKKGGYIAAIAVRTRFGIVSAVLEFDTQENVPMMILGVLQGLEEGGDAHAVAKRFIEIENLAMASTMETAETKCLARNKREVDFSRKQAKTPELLGVY